MKQSHVKYQKCTQFLKLYLAMCVVLIHRSDSMPNEQKDEAKHAQNKQSKTQIFVWNPILSQNNNMHSATKRLIATVNAADKANSSDRQFEIASPIQSPSPSASAGTSVSASASTNSNSTPVSHQNTTAPGSEHTPSELLLAVQTPSPSAERKQPSRANAGINRQFISFSAKDYEEKSNSNSPISNSSYKMKWNPLFSENKATSTAIIPPPAFNLSHYMTGKYDNDAQKQLVGLDEAGNNEEMGAHQKQQATLQSQMHQLHQKQASGVVPASSPHRDAYVHQGFNEWSENDIMAMIDFTEIVPPPSTQNAAKTNEPSVISDDEHGNKSNNSAIEINERRKSLRSSKRLRDDVAHFQTNEIEKEGNTIKQNNQTENAPNLKFRRISKIHREQKAMKQTLRRKHSADPKGKEHKT